MDRVDVCGKQTAAASAEDVKYSAGENVGRRDNEFVASRDGAVFIGDNAVSVCDVFIQPGDIDAFGKRDECSGLVCMCHFHFVVVFVVECS